jgi:hypothetical protein
LFFDDGEERVWGKNRPFRLLFQRCYEVVVRSCGRQEAEKWKKQFTAVFLKFTFTFSQPDKYSFLVRNSKQAGSPFGFHTSVHQKVEDGVERQNIGWLKRSMWSTGSDKRYMNVNTAKLPQQTVAETIKRAKGAMTGRQ